MILSRFISLTKKDSYQLWDVPDFSVKSTTAVETITEKDVLIGSEEPVNLSSQEEFPDFDRKSQSITEENTETQKALQAMQATHQQQVKQIEQILQAMTSPLERVNSAVERELVELSVAIAKMILRKEISEKPAHLLDLAKQAIKQLPAASLSIVVHLHPQDADVIIGVLESSGNTLDWEIEEDPALNPGDCHIVTNTSFIDASVDSLVDRLAKDMLGSYSVTDFNENEADVI